MEACLGGPQSMLRLVARYPDPIAPRKMQQASELTLIIDSLPLHTQIIENG